MHSITLSRLTTGTLALLLTGSIAHGLHQANTAASAAKQAGAWQREAAGWQAVAQQSAAHDDRSSLKNQALTRRYNALVVATAANEKRLAKALQAKADAAAAAAKAAPAASASSASSGSGSAAASAPVQAVAPVQAAPAQAPQSAAS